jgi:uncharacterized protein YdiU (UPF0061 family)
MQLSNPAFIPRNHLVESALKEAQDNNNLTEFNELLSKLSKPYHYNIDPNYQTPSLGDEGSYRTYCGT